MNYTKFFTAILLSGAFLVTLSACGAAESSVSAAKMTEGAAKTDPMATEVSWLNNLDKAKAAANQKGTIIMVDVYTDWCHWCKELDKNVYTDSKVIDLSNKIVNLKLNAEDNGQGTALAKKFKIEGYPTILFITADGQEVDRIGGYLPPEDFAKAMQKILDGKTYMSYSKALDEGTLEEADKLDALGKFVERHDTARTKKIADGLDPKTITPDSAREHAYMLLTNYNLGTRNYGKAESLLVEFVNAFPQSEMTPQAYLFIVVTNVYQKDMDDAKKYMAILKEKYPGEKDIIAQAEQVLSQAS